MKKKLFEQKIDVLITERKNINDNNFLKLILPESVHIKTW